MKQKKKFCLMLTLFVTAQLAMAHTPAYPSAACIPERPDAPQTLVPMGNAIGIQIHAGGVMITALTPVDTENGDCSPALEAGMAAGDTITHVNKKQVDNAKDFFEAIQRTRGADLTLRGRRDDSPLSVRLKAVRAQSDERYRIGAWVRDSMAGIGTVTFYNPANGDFGALGHGIHEAETNRLMPLARGSAAPASIVDVRRGQAGSPGELRGSFDLNKPSASLYANTANGIFGTVEKGFPAGNAALPIGRPEDATVGKAVLYSQVQGDTVCEYGIEISRVANGNDGRNMLFRVTDQRLLSATGGIVQGMSGSPIVQNGKIIGAVTHVLINDPQRGYGIFITNMLADNNKPAPLEKAA